MPIRDNSEPKHRLFTVITVTRNNLSGLKATAASVEVQHGVQLEHIIIDGLSSDDTVAWLTERNTRRPFSWISEQDNGIYDAMNKGLRRTQPGIVIFLNAGDVFSSPRTLADIDDFLSSSGAIWGYGNARFVSQLGDEHGSVYRHGQYDPTRHVRAQRFVPHQAMFAPASLYSKFGLFQESAGLSADQYQIAAMARHEHPGYLDKVLVNFLAGGASSQQSKLAHSFRYRRLRRLLNEYVGGSSLIDLGWTACQVTYRSARSAMATAKQRARPRRAAMVESRSASSNTRKSFWEQDLQMNDIEKLSLRIALSRPELRFIWTLRWLEHERRVRDLLSFLTRPIFELLFVRISIRCGFVIPPHVFGPGLSIAHHGGIVVNEKARVGARCRIHSGVTIGSGSTGSPTIHAGVYIGPGVVISGAVTVGSGSAIGANSVVLHDVPSNVTVAGAPARVVSNRGAASIYLGARSTGGPE